MLEGKGPFPMPIDMFDRQNAIAAELPGPGSVFTVWPVAGTVKVTTKRKLPRAAHE